MKLRIIFIILLVISLPLLGRWIDTGKTGIPDLFQCEQQTDSISQVDFNLDGYELESKEYAGEVYTAISHPEAGDLLNEGMPDVPVFAKALIIPDQGEVMLKVVSYEQKVISDVLVYPEEEMQHDNEAPRDRFTINREFYRGSSIYPEEIAWTGTPAIMRDFRVVPVSFCPFQYDPAQRTLTIYTNIRVEITVSGRDGINAKYAERKRSRAFEGIYQANTLNYDQLSLRDEYQVPTIIFICNNDANVVNNLAYLADWKRQKGFNVVVATTSETGSTNTSIKAYIQDAYDNWENPPEYVNIMGDGGGTYTIPTWYSSGEGDHPYSQLEGDDVLGDVIMGRMTFSSITSLQTVISKVLAYEKTPYTGNTAWYSRALLTGDPSSSGYSTITVCKAVKELMLDYEGNFWDDDNFVEVYTSPFATQMNAAINLGVSYYSYRGYMGTSGWYYGNTSNGYMMPFAVIPTCASNNWASGTGNAEGFYLDGTTTLADGGIGALGTTTTGTHTPFNNALALGIWGGIFRDDIFSMGGAVLQGKYYLWLTFPQNPSNYVYNFSHWNTLMGDGSLELWTRVPQTLTASYIETIPFGSSYYLVSVMDSIGNAAEGAWVTLTGDDTDFSITGYCDANGEIILDLDGADEGDYTLVISKHDHIPVVEEITIEQVEQFVDIEDVVYDDSAGNGNGQVNPGETVEVMLTLENSGTMAVSDVTVTLNCDNEYLTILTNNIAFGEIPAGGSSTAVSGFEIEFDDAIQGGVEIVMNAIISGSGHNIWETCFMVRVYGPSLYASDYTIAGDGVIVPGETADLYFTIENNGELPAAGVTGQLTCGDNRIIIVDDNGSFGTIAAGSSSNNSLDRYTITAGAAIVPGTYIPFSIHLTSLAGYDSFVNISVPIGEAVLSDPYGPDDHGYMCYDDGDVYYNLCPAYDWIEIDHDYGGAGTSISWAGGTATGTGGGTGNFANIMLPGDFTFVFYGIEYHQICVCTNGWIAPGYHETANFMNYQIPGPQGPSPMIAAFWDDLNIGSGDVLRYFDEDLHYYVVEWSRITNGDTGAGETFQIILYDPIYYPTNTGDSEIKMQYMDVTNNNAGSYPSNHGQYCTLGLENEDSQTGLQYTFNNAYPAACKPLEDNMAILFTTNTPEVLEPPSALLNVEEFSFQLEPGETGSNILEIGNDGEANLVYNISKDYQSRDMGGPDAYGYMWYDSDEPGGPVYNWVDISTTGTQVSFTGNDTGTGFFDIGFSFNFYEEDYTQFRINPNGWIGFGSDNSEWSNEAIPNPNAPCPALLPFWDDLYPEIDGNGGGNVYYFSTGTELIVMFDQVEHYAGVNNGTYDFEVIINSEGSIKYQYHSLSGDIDTNTIGIQDAGGTNGLQVCFNSDYLHEDMAIEFYQIIDWLQISQASGIVTSGENQQITITVETSELELGDYLCHLHLTTNDPNLSDLIIPVELSVGSVVVNYGDVDSNGYVEAYDASISLQYFVGMDPIPAIDPIPWEPLRILAADVDGNGAIESYDASLILQYYVGIINVFPVEINMREMTGIRASSNADNKDKSSGSKKTQNVLYKK
ncbi:MAG: hypothetical protein K9N06_03635 [Candidatus Cloacimonetes bacterium]|nr:hypothetical protein [Candidatus Cloacimonadota bacterium]